MARSGLEKSVDWELDGLSSADVDLAIAMVDLPLVLWDESTLVILLVNPAACERIALPENAVIGHRTSEFLDTSGGADQAAEALSRGTIDDLRAHRTLKYPDEERAEVLVWTKTVTVDGRRCGLTLLASDEDLPRIERDPTRPWRELSPIAVGMLDSDGRILSVSAEITAILGGKPEEWIGTPLEEIVRGDERRAVRAMVEDPAVSVINRGVHVCPERRSTSDAWLIAARSRAPGRSEFAFALVGACRSGPGQDRVLELEEHLRRIGAEVRAAGVLDDLSAPGSLEGCANELAGLSTRQWEIVARLRRGYRVQTIADELFLSPSTVRNHLSSVFRRFEVHSQAELLSLLSTGRRAP